MYFDDLWYDIIDCNEYHVVMHTLQSESLKKRNLFAKNMNLHQRNITNKLDSIFWAKTKLKQDTKNLCKA